MHLLLVLLILGLPVCLLGENQKPKTLGITQTIFADTKYAGVSHYSGAVEYAEEYRRVFANLPNIARLAYDQMIELHGGKDNEPLTMSALAVRTKGDAAFVYLSSSFGGQGSLLYKLGEGLSNPDGKKAAIAVDRCQLQQGNQLMNGKPYSRCAEPLVILQYLINYESLGQDANMLSQHSSIAIYGRPEPNKKPATRHTCLGERPSGCKELLEELGVGWQRRQFQSPTPDPVFNPIKIDLPHCFFAQPPASLHPAPVVKLPPTKTPPKLSEPGSALTTEDGFQWPLTEQVDAAGQPEVGLKVGSWPKRGKLAISKGRVFRELVKILRQPTPPQPLESLEKHQELPKCPTRPAKALYVAPHHRAPQEPPRLPPIEDNGKERFIAPDNPPEEPLSGSKSSKLPSEHKHTSSGHELPKSPSEHKNKLPKIKSPLKIQPEPPDPQSKPEAEHNPSQETTVRLPFQPQNLRPILLSPHDSQDHEVSTHQLEPMVPSIIRPLPAQRNERGNDQTRQSQSDLNERARINFEVSQHNSPVQRPSRPPRQRPQPATWPASSMEDLSSSDSDRAIMLDEVPKSN